MKHPNRMWLTVLLCALAVLPALSQIDSTLLRRQRTDTTGLSMNMDAVYDRPFLAVGKLPVSIGGYVEANWQHLGTDGVSEGHQFQMRRLTIFLASNISRRINFLSEIEFEDGTKEINIEFASLDFEFHPLLNLRGGIIMNPIGAFNQNHDGPKWDFVDRPVSATQLLPATWSNVGVGLYGKLYRNNWVYAYEAYLTNGFDGSIISNGENKTFLPAAKANPDRFEESFNGVPLFTGKVAIRNKKLGELGLSYMGGVYNKFQEDGMVLDSKRRLHVFAIDLNTVLPIVNTYINTEWAHVSLDVPETYTRQYGHQQVGGYVDVVQPVFRKNILGFDRSVINAVFRFEYVDWNVGTFNETGTNIYDELVAIVPGISWRLTSQTVLRWNYRYHWQTDLLGNPASKTAGFQVGFASYF